MEIVIVITVTLLVALFVTLPLFRYEKDEYYRNGEYDNPEIRLVDELKILNARKESLYSALRDIDFDYGLGKLTKEDFQELENAYKYDAVEILKQIGEIEKKLNLNKFEERIENEIRNYKNIKHKEIDEIELEISKARRKA